MIPPFSASHRALWGRRRRLAAAVILTCAAATAGCGLRVGEGSVSTLPSLSAEQSAQDAVARAGLRIASTAESYAQVEEDAGTGSPQWYRDEASRTRAQVESIGGLWQPWPSPLPTDLPSQFPTVAPAPTAAPEAQLSDLVTALDEGIEAASQAALTDVDGARARSFAQLSCLWRVDRQAIEPDPSLTAGRPTSVPLASQPGDLQAADSATASASAGQATSDGGVDSGTHTATEAASESPSAPSAAQAAGLTPGLVAVYDQARYSLESIAARAGAMRQTASAEAAYAGALVDAGVAAHLDGERRPAYAPLTASDGAPQSALAESGELNADAQWAIGVLEHVKQAELAVLGDNAPSSSAREYALAGACHAEAALSAWR